MSSVTIWTTVCPLAQPCSSTSGLKTSTFAVPDRAVLGELAVRHRRPQEVLGGAGEEVLGGHVPVVGAQELLDRLTAGVVRALSGGVQELLTGLLQRRRHGCRLHPHSVVVHCRRTTPCDAIETIAHPSHAAHPAPPAPSADTFAQVNVCFLRQCVVRWSVCIPRTEGVHVIVLGIILLILGLLVNSLSILVTIGAILIVVGLVLAVLGGTGRAIGGRKHWY